jgi:hypothetical protein
MHKTNVHRQGSILSARMARRSIGAAKAGIVASVVAFLAAPCPGWAGEGNIQQNIFAPSTPDPSPMIDTTPCPRDIKKERRRLNNRIADAEARRAHIAAISNDRSWEINGGTDESLRRQIEYDDLALKALDNCK